MREVVITGVGIVGPLGVGRQAFSSALAEGRSGIDRIRQFDPSALPVQIGGEVRDYDAKQYVKPRKSMKVMSRDIQIAFGAAELAWEEAGLGEGNVDPERLGVVLGSDFIYGDIEDLEGPYRSCLVNSQFNFERWGEHALSEMYPLWMLKYLPNMAACHIGISHDGRGPTNSITLGDVSSLLALDEALRVIERGAADVIISGGMGSRLHPTALVYRSRDRLSHRNDAPQQAPRPFDARRDGMVNAEGAAMLVLESREHAQRRGAKILGRLVSASSRFQPGLPNGHLAPAQAIRVSLATALQAAVLEPSRLGAIFAHGVATHERDRAEAQAIADVAGNVPVTALQSYQGNTGASSGAMAIVASVLALEKREIPRTLNYQEPDPECPINIVAHEPAPLAEPTLAVLGHNATGQAVTVVVAAES